jgi:hypothetical protein
MFDAPSETGAASRSFGRSLLRICEGLQSGHQHQADMPAAAGSFTRGSQFRENRTVFTSGSEHPIYRLDVQPRNDSMSRNLALILIGLLGSLVAPESAYAQLTPPAGSAGAGNSPISGVPSVPPIPARSATPAASATHRGSRRLVETRRRRQLSTDPSVHHRHAW